MQIAILAGGLATRLGELAKNEPKSLLKIQGKPFIEYQIKELFPVLIWQQQLLAFEARTASKK